jgi:hypothetical protein
LAGAAWFIQANVLHWIAQWSVRVLSSGDPRQSLMQQAVCQRAA